MHSRIRRGFWVLSLTPWLVFAGPIQSAPDAPDAKIFATVGDQFISVNQFLGAMRDGVRRRYYHGKIPEQERDSFQREVANQLIDRTLVLAEARRQGLEPDANWVEQQLNVIDQRAERNPQWKKHRDRMLPMLRQQLEEGSLVRRMEYEVRDVPAPDDAVLRAYYDVHLERFTEPERFRVSAILLKVDPSSPAQVWKAAAAEAAQLVDKLRAGASFPDLARLHSADASAERGGDMGYLHRGMLGEPAQKAVDAAEVGEITDPVKLLEGVGIFRIDDRREATIMPFDQARDRAKGLWLREQRDAAWQLFVKRLRDQVVIQVNEQHFLWSSKDDAAKM